MDLSAGRQDEQQGVLVSRRWTASFQLLLPAFSQAHPGCLRAGCRNLSVGRQ